MTSRREATRATVLRGQQHLQRGEWAQAEQTLRPLISGPFPDCVEDAKLLLGQLLAEQGNAVEAESLLSACINSDRPAIRSRARVNLAELLRRLGRTDEAIALFDSIASPSGSDDEVYALLRKGDLLHWQGHLEDAVSAYERLAMSADEDYAPAARMGLARIAADLGDVERAIEEYEFALAGNFEPVRPVAARELAQLLDRNGREHAAAGAYSLAIELADRSEQPELQMALARCLTVTGAPADAEALYRSLLNDRDFASRAARAAGSLARKAGRIAESSELLQTAAEGGDDETRALALIELSLIDRFMGDIELAESRLREASSSSVTEYATDAKMRLGELLIEHGEAEEGEGWLRSAAESNDPSASGGWAWLTLALRLAATDRTDEARVIYRRLIEWPIGNTSRKARVNLANLLRESDWPSAEELYRSVVETGHDEIAARALLNLVAGNLALRQLDDVESMLDAVLELDSSLQSNVELLRGEVCVLEGRLSEGITWLCRAVDADDESVALQATVALGQAEDLSKE